MGSTLRYGISLALASWFGSGWPFGTFVVNAIGSFAIGVVMPFFAGREDDPLRMLFVVGVLGGFTTYSSFNYETLALLEDEGPSRALAYGGATVLVCLLLGALGFGLSRAIR